MGTNKIGILTALLQNMDEDIEVLWCLATSPSTTLRAIVLAS